jgi:hypothetical protein
MKKVGSFGVSAPFIGDFSVQETLVAATVALWASATGGTLSVSTTTGLADAMGLVVSAAEGASLTYNTTQGGTLGIATIIYDPMAIYEARIVPSATSGTEYAAGDGYLVVEENGDTNGVTITDTEVVGSTDDMNDGEVFGITGANTGRLAHRTITDHTATTLVVVVPFANDIAVGDTFLASQYGPGVLNVQTTSDLTEANGVIAGGTGGAARVVKVRADKDHDGATASAPRLYLDMVLLDHAFNSFTN